MKRRTKAELVTEIYKEGGETAVKAWRKAHPREKVDLSGTDLAGANFSKADLDGVDFSNADLKRANFHKATLRDALLDGADLRQADLRDADLSRARMGGADLKYANFSRALIAETVLVGAEISEANFQTSRGAPLGKDKVIAYVEAQRQAHQDFVAP